MKTLAKIILASSLITLAACSGKGSGESRIHNIPSDEDENPAPQVIDDEEVIPSETPSGEDGPKGNVFACRDMSGAYCAETTDMSLKSECDPDDGEKNMTLKITDQTLLSLTGGIVQGMSGSPILQDGKIIGAVTHVFVSDPTQGYGVFIDWMLGESDGLV